MRLTPHNHDKAKRWAELYARKCLGYYLRAVCGRDFRMRRGSDPPDWELTLGGYSYPVEVTRIVSRARFAGREVPSLMVESELFALAGEVGRGVLRIGPDLGTHIMTIDNLSLDAKQRKSVVQDAIEYVLRTKHTEDAAEKRLIGNAEGEIAIRKVRSGQTYVGPMVSLWPGGTGVSGEELRTVLRKELTAKSVTMHSLPRPQILLLVDNVGWGHDQRWADYVPGDQLSNFDAIIRAHGMYTCEVIHSNNRLEWLRNGR